MKKKKLSDLKNIPPKKWMRGQIHLPSIYWCPCPFCRIWWSSKIRPGRHKQLGRNFECKHRDRELGADEWFSGSRLDQNDWQVKNFPSNEKTKTSYFGPSGLSYPHWRTCRHYNAKALELAEVKPRWYWGRYFWNQNGKLTGVPIDTQMNTVAGVILRQINNNLKKLFQQLKKLFCCWPHYHCGWRTRSRNDRTDWPCKRRKLRNENFRNVER